MYALVDANNFYVSCERLFRPDLQNKPVVVLSNNDGCFISRSDEVKKLGIPMGAPYFKWKDQVVALGATVFSANFSLYGDLSNRMMQILHRFCPDSEVYSIDEAFLQLPDWLDWRQQQDYAQQIAQAVWQEIGIPVSIGIGPTKTLAKLANYHGKQHKDRYPKRVFHLASVPDLDLFLSRIPVAEVWGIGRAHAQLMQQEGIQSALQLRDLPDHWVDRQMTIVGLRMVHELRGFSCLPLEQTRSMKKAICSSRSFGHPVTSLRELREAVASYAARAAEKLRQEGGVAAMVWVSIRSNRFRPESYTHASRGFSFAEPTQYTPTIARAATSALTYIYQNNTPYKKAAVMLTGITPARQTQMSLFHNAEQQDKQNHLMQAVDQLNAQQGRRSLRFAAEGTRQLWTGKQALQSPRFTTRWEDLLRVRG
jgi:DNA polymerase V